MPFKRIWSLALAMAAVLALASAPAHAQDEATKQRARELYQQGKTQFDLGNFEEAIRLFKEVYKLSPQSVLLFNLGQAYRQMGDCRQAIFFYRRYLTVEGEGAKNKEFVETSIAELSETCKATEAIKSKEPLGAMEPAEGDGEGDLEDEDEDEPERVAAAGDDDDDADADASVGVRKSRGTSSSQPGMLGITAEIGPALLQLGDLNVSGAQLAAAVGAGYPLDLGSMIVDLGARIGYVLMPWENMVTSTSGNTSMISLLASANARYPVTPTIAVRGELGVGLLMLTGISRGHIFLNPGDEVQGGALSTFNVRGGVGAEYSIAPNLAGLLSVVYSYSPAVANLIPEVSAFSHIGFLLGVGYRL